jgi:hypothetical protein
LAIGEIRRRNFLDPSTCQALADFRRIQSGGFDRSGEILANAPEIL